MCEYLYVRATFEVLSGRRPARHEVHSIWNQTLQNKTGEFTELCKHFICQTR